MYVLLSNSPSTICSIYNSLIHSLWILLWIFYNPFGGVQMLQHFNCTKKHCGIYKNPMSPKKYIHIGRDLIRVDDLLYKIQIFFDRYSVMLIKIYLSLKIKLQNKKFKYFKVCKGKNQISDCKGLLLFFLTTTLVLGSTAVFFSFFFPHPWGFFDCKVDKWLRIYLKI